MWAILFGYQYCLKTIICSIRIAETYDKTSEWVKSCQQRLPPEQPLRVAMALVSVSWDKYRVIGCYMELWVVTSHHIT